MVFYPPVTDEKAETLTGERTQGFIEEKELGCFLIPGTMTFCHSTVSSSFLPMPYDPSQPKHSYLSSY